MDATMVEAAREFAPMLRERSDEVEHARRIPDDLARSLAGRGFYRMWAPEQVGGMAHPLVPTLETLETLAEADASVSWCVAIGITSTLCLISLPEATRESVFASPETILAGVFAPMGRADAIDGGFRVSGQWRFGSGTQNASFVLAGCRYFQDGEPMLDEKGLPRTQMALVPASSVEFLDTWDVSGLSGTGSTDFKLQDVFVTEDYISGWTKHTPPEATLYRIPQLTLLAVGFGAIALGLGRAALDEVVAMASKTATGHSHSLAERRDVQSDYARADAQLSAARAFYYERAHVLWQEAVDGRPSLDARARMRQATNHAVEVAAEVTRTAYLLGGGTAIYKGSRLQRYFRDSHVITQHVQVRPELYSVVGSHQLGAARGTAVL